MSAISYLVDDYSFTKEQRLPIAEKYDKFMKDLEDNFISKEDGLFVNSSTCQGFQYRMDSDECYGQGMCVAALAAASFVDEKYLPLLKLALKGLASFTGFCNEHGRGVRAWCPADSNAGRSALRAIEEQKQHPDPENDGYYYRLHDDIVTWEDFSTDQFNAMAWGLTFAWLLGDSVAKMSAAKIAREFAEKIIADGYILRNPDGTPTRFNNCTGWTNYVIPVCEGLLPLLVCARIADDAFGSILYDTVMRDRHGKLVVKYGFYDTHLEPISSNNNLFMHGAAIYCLRLLTGNSIYRQEWDTFYGWVKKYNNPFYSLANYAATRNEYDKEVVKRQLNYFPNDKRIMAEDNSELLQKVSIMPWKNRYGYYVAKYGLPISRQNIFFNTFTNNLRNIGLDNEHADGSRFWSGADYIFLYAMAKSTSIIS